MDFLPPFCVLLLCFSLANAEDCQPTAAPPNPKDGCCGRAVGVTKAVPGIYPELTQYPWMGIIEYQKDDKTKLHCSAVLISGRYMLSAAQCFGNRGAGTPTNVRLGEYNTSNDGPDCVDVGGSQDCNDGAVKIPIEKIISHPEYNKAHNFEHDIALIRLAQMAPRTDFIQPICVPTSDIIDEAPKHHFWTAGWGAINDTSPLSELLHHVDLPYVDHDTCQSVYNNVRPIKLGNGQLCAGGEEGKDSCKSSSGGPLMYVRDHTTELVGIVSFGKILCGQEGSPSVYTKVFAYDAWIRENIKE